ncbi:hypothetical protein KP509_27G057600 [Ceratopteris richardii]|uniref:ABC transporter domain-containing protein n=1 Tax=Ceratopteris richardii TaxID=49495 RepID=A0A8T2RJ57_CERRI|nr:hypothetical protein KP509_27G057600 [Ceratopteris richardii]
MGERVGIIGKRIGKRRGLAILLGGGLLIVCSRIVRRQLKALQARQATLCLSISSSSLSLSPPLPGKPKIAVDSIFVRRLTQILKICIPSFRSKETFQIFLQTWLLYSRTQLSDRIAFLEGKLGQAVVSKDWVEFTSSLLRFSQTAIPAAVVNSALKFLQTIISLSFQKRLTEYLHQYYLSDRVYYAAAVLGSLSNPDQRITEDVAKFSTSISDLYSNTFKPILDIVLFTRSLARTIGYKGQLLLYGYFVLCSIFLRTVSPPLALMATQEASLSGNFRNAHQRIVSHAEEIAYNDPPGGEIERMILNNHLYRMMQHSQLSAAQRFLQQVADGYLVKYTASVVGLCVFAAPFYFNSKNEGLLSTGEYIRAIRLMMNTSKAIGQLILLYKRVTSLAASTSRVSELLESVKCLRAGQDQKTSIARQKSNFMESNKNQLMPSLPKIILSDRIAFRNVSIYTPDNILLIQGLNFEVVPGGSVIIMGPNGSGKSSVFRLLAELWPLHDGIIERPPRKDMFYLSQRPYVVQGTLRDQVLYPSMRTWISNFQSNSDRAKAHLNMDSGDDARIIESLRSTELEYLLGRGNGLDQYQNWEETLSGGEKQRLAISRLLYHNPKFALLDECTSAVSADGEEKLYNELHKSGITLLSIAHRPAVKKFHLMAVHIDGDQSKAGWWIETLNANGNVVS